MKRTWARLATIVVTALLGICLGGLVMWAIAAPERQASHESSDADLGAAVVPFYGSHQAGIETPPQAHATFVALDLLPETDLSAMGRLMRAWTDDAAKLSQGEPIIGDSAAALAAHPAGLTITFGFGFSAFEHLGVADRWPLAEEAIPAYSIDRLQNRWNDGDVIVQVAGDDPITNFHAAHQLMRTGTPFAYVRWIQRGFLNAAGVNEDEPGRNLLGQVDGTANAPAGSPEFADRTWASSPADFIGGTAMVVRRIAFDMDAWDQLSSSNKGSVIGRDLDSGAPLSGGGPEAPMDLAAPNPSTSGPAISEDAHARLAFTSDNSGITRRGYNFDDGISPSGERDVGLIFVAFQSDVQRYLRIQELLAQSDRLNTYTTPVGSALFAVPPGVEPGGWVGETLFSTGG